MSRRLLGAGTADEVLRLPIVGAVLWLAACSAVVVESDTYRYACGILALIGLYFYLRMTDRPTISWVGWLCMGWAAYAFAIFLVMFAFWPGHPIGESEFLYCFPLFFPILGFALSIYWKSMERIIAAFHIGGLLMLLLTTKFSEVASGETVRPLIQNNQIHGAVCCGILFVTSCFWLLHYVTEKRSDRTMATISFLVAPPVMALSLFCIYGAKSKGVWLALGLTLPLLAILVLRRLKMGKGTLVFAVALAGLLLGTYAVRANLDQFAGPTVQAAETMLWSAGHDGGAAADVAATIASSSTPISMDERLQLWWNASELIASSPILGWGNEWLNQWHHAKYGSIKYDLMHNGYLEILVRYGVVGALVFLLMLTVFIRSVQMACRDGIIPPCAFYAYLTVLVFFAFTLLSNSNNRLAIGESLALVSSAFACACHFFIEQRRRAVANGDRHEVSS
ncbi:O-antigen ligase domain-containing protein [Neorhizobium sp. P12A]|nr:O-antigen ligase domain-containing protein [Neorhizobium sp. P12A]